MVGDEKKRTYIVAPNDPNFLFVGHDATFNNRGTVAFADSRHNVFTVGPNGTQLLFDGGVNAVVSSSSPVIADSGLVVFVANADAPRPSILFLHDGRKLTPLVEVDKGSDGTEIRGADVNSAGQVVFIVGPPCCSEGDEYRLYLWDSGRVELITTVPPFFATAINNLGEIAFYESVASTVFTFKDGQITRVLGAGDLLFGRTVEAVHFSEWGTGLNDVGQLAFLVWFAEGGAAVVRADPR
jgi:hypothetical protein